MGSPIPKTAQDDSKKSINYGTFKLSIPEIVSALHQKAIAAVNDKTLRIANSAVESDGKQTKLNSAGQHIISALPVKEGEYIQKENALKALQTYVQWFVGPDLAKKVTDNVLLPLGNKESTNESIKVKSFMEFFLESLNEASEAEVTGDQNDADDAEEEDDVDDAGEADNGEESGDDDNAEEAGDEDDNGVSSENDGENTSGDKPDENGIITDENGKQSAVGWYIAYNLKVQGLKESSLKDAMKDFAVNFFDNLTIKASGLFGGGDVITGKDVRKSFHDLLHVDHKKLADNVDDYLRKKFPGVRSIEVKTRDSKTLYNEVKSNSQLTKEEKTAISSVAYCLWIKVKEENPQKPFLNKVKVAEAIRKCMAAFRIGKKAQITKDSIIKIENFVDKDDDESFANNAKRPDSSEIKEILTKDSYQPDASGNLSYTSGLELLNKIKKKFQNITKSKKAMGEKENKDAVAILKKLEDKCKKVKDGQSFLRKDFDDFYQEYLKFESKLSESVSFTFLPKSDVAIMILETLFEDMPKSQLDDVLAEQLVLETSEDDVEEETAEEASEEDGSGEESSQQTSSSNEQSDESASEEASAPASKEDEASSGTDLYIFPIASSKDFEEGAELNK